MASVLVTLTIKTLISFGRVPSYLVHPFEVRLFFFYLLQHLVYRFLEYGVYCLHVMLGHLAEK